LSASIPLVLPPRVFTAPWREDDLAVGSWLAM
jgi:hypothetical protein